MNPDERTAHDAVLAWCRKNHGKVMREYFPPEGTKPRTKECRILDVLANEPDPDHPPFVRTKRLAIGDSWTTVAALLGVAL